MSASSKKKLRKEQEAAFLTEKQRQQSKEAKSLKTQTIIFVTVLILIAATAITMLTFNFVNRSGYFQNNTIALTVGGHKLTNTMFNYYFMDAINEEYSDWSDSYGSYVDTIMAMYGLDLSKPLNKQIQDEKTGATWADYFMEAAIANARFDYAMVNLAAKAEHTLTEEELKDVTLEVDTLEFYSMIYGYGSVQEYLEYSYGFGSTKENYTEYCRIQALADSYYNKYQDSLTYDDPAIREYENGKEDPEKDETRYNNYTCYDFTEIYLSYRDFLTGGQKDENGKVTYTDADNDAAVKAAEAAAKSLLSCKSVEELKTALLALKLNDKAVYEKEDELDEILTEHERTFYTSLTTYMKEWISSADRKAGDIIDIESSSTSKDEDGNETTTIGGYYVLLFHGKDENKTTMGNVRHLLVEFEGGKTENGKTVYSDDEKKKALDEAEKLLKEWQDGEKKDEESFIELVKKHTDDTASAETGGLYEDINTDSTYMENFQNWALDAKRQKGDVEIVETDYGYHIMYYVGASDLNYRDYMISNDLRAEEMKKWKETETENISVEKGNMQYIDFGMSIK